MDTEIYWEDVKDIMLYEENNLKMFDATGSYTIPGLLK